MPTGLEILGILIAILVIWIVLKVAKLAIRLFLFGIVVLVILGFVYYFMR